MHYLPSLLLLLRRSCTKARWRAETGEASEFGGALYALPCALIYPRARSTSARRSYTEARRAEGEKKRNPAKLQNGALILRIPARARARALRTRDSRPAPGLPPRRRVVAARGRRGDASSTAAPQRAYSECDQRMQPFLRTRGNPYWRHRANPRKRASVLQGEGCLAS